MTEQTAGKKGTKADNRVLIPLSNPLTKEQVARYVGNDDAKDLWPGDKMWVSKQDARSIIGAGFAQVDPEDKAAVKAALAGEAPATAPAG